MWPVLHIMRSRMRVLKCSTAMRLDIRQRDE
jgi:hypothetical protein